jgi:hypothetical protein
VKVDASDKTAPKAAWEMVFLPKKQGGLGVLNFEIHNEALLLKNLQISKQAMSTWLQSVH